MECYIVIILPLLLLLAFGAICFPMGYCTWPIAYYCLCAFAYAHAMDQTWAHAPPCARTSDAAQAGAAILPEAAQGGQYNCPIEPYSIPFYEY